jgi:predicted phage baseplate assembly protein
MPLQAPILDDRQYADIVAQAKTLIPRYAPEWTNFNDSDPGITLVQLFAWMTDIILYRLNQVPDLNYIKFLQLLGIELNPAQPAKAELTFTLARPDVPPVIVPQGTQVAAAADGNQPIVFETDESLIAIGTQLVALQSYDGLGYLNLSGKNNTPKQWFYPFGQNPQPGSALVLGFSSQATSPAGPIEFPSDQINLAVTLYSDGLTPPLALCSLPVPPPATLAWEYWDGRQWEPISIDSDGTRAFTQNGHIFFPGPGSFIQAAPLGKITDSLYWIRARLISASYEIPPQVAAILTNTISATQATTITDEVLGGSDGTPNQGFQLANAPVVVLATPIKVGNSDGTSATITSLRLEVDEGLGFMVWQQVDDFFASKPDSPHFVLNRTIGQVTFGDGEHGRIPAANLTNPTGNIVARNYRFGGGSGGNVGGQTITQLQTFVPSVNSVTNYQAATGGTDEESLADAKHRAASALKSNDRAVTNEDFEYLATQAPCANVIRAKALPLFHPDFPTGQIPGVVTVIVIPNSNAPNPTPNQTTLQAVCQYLNAHRLLTSEVYVVGPTYRKIKVQASLVVQPGSDLGTVKNAVVTALTNFFSPLTGGPDNTGWPFGGEIYYSDVYRIIIETPGVLRIQNNQLILFLDDQRQQFCRDIAINAGELLYNDPKGHDIQVAYSVS